jgi:hypothetical protein
MGAANGSKTTLINNWKLWPAIQILNFKVGGRRRGLTVVCPIELSTSFGQFSCVGMELYCLRKSETDEGYLSVVNAPPKNEQEARDKLKILVE